MALLHQCGNGHWMDSLDSERQRTLVCKTKTSTSLNRREIQLIRKTGWGTTERERDRWTEREREDAVLYEKGGCKPDRCR